MLKMFAAFLLIITGIQATSALNQFCEKMECNRPDTPEDFPTTNEDLQKFCTPKIDWLTCRSRYDEECLNLEPEKLLLGHRILATWKKICSEDTLLHAAVVDNLECFSKLVKTAPSCPDLEGQTERVQQFAGALIEEGLLSNSENDTDELHQCLRFLDFVSCIALNVETECGTVGMDAFVEIVQGFRPRGRCDELHELLPALIRLYKLEEEKKQSIAEDFRERK